MTGPDPLWVADAARMLKAVQQALAEGQPPEEGHAAECRWCPLCQGVGMIRRVGPDVLEQVSTFALSLAAALREGEAAGAGRTAGEERPEVVDVREPAPRPAPTPTVPIDVTD